MTSLFAQGKEKKPGIPLRVQALFLVPIIVSLLVLGVFIGDQEAQRLDLELRDQLTEQAEMIAEAIDPMVVNRLTFTEADLKNPAYQHLRDRMVGHANFVSIRSIYSVARKDGHFVFGPESLDPSDPLASRPGSIYISPPEGLSQAFEKKRTVSVGPYTDEYGTFVSAFSPVLEGGTNNVVMVIGVDLPAASWIEKVDSARHTPIYIAVGFMVVGLLAWAIARWKVERQTEGGKPRLRYFEPAIMFASGLVITAGIVHVSVKQLSRERAAIFRTLAQDNVNLVREEFNFVRDLLREFARYDAAGIKLSDEKFHLLAAPALQAHGIDSLQWARREVRSGQTRYSVLFAEPKERARNLIGTDVGEDPARRDAISAAVYSGLISSTSLGSVEGESPGDPGMSVFQTVYSDGVSPEKLSGVVVASIRFQQLLENTIGRHVSTENPLLKLRLVEVGAGKGNRTLELAKLGGPAGSAQESPVQLTDKELKSPWTYPLFFFGKTYALIATPTEGFVAAHPLNAAWWLGAAGIFVSLIFTAFAWFMANRQADLARKVTESTAVIRENAHALEESVRRFQGMFKYHEAPMLLVVPDSGQIVDVNESGSRFYGYSVERMKKMNIDEINTLAPKEAKRRRLAALYGGATYVVPHRLASGSVRLVEVHSSPIPVGGENLLFAVIWDVTERESAAERLRESETRWKFALEGSGDGLWELNVRRNTMKFSDQFKAMLGFGPQEIANDAAEFERRIHPEDHDPVLADLGKHLAGESALTEVEFRILMKSGEYKWVLGRGKVLKRSQNGNPLVVIGTIRDIDKRKREEQHRISLQTHLERTSKLAALGTLASGMAHEINNPLAIIKGNIAIVEDALKERAHDADVVLRSLERKSRAVERIAKIVENMRAYASMDTPTVSPVDVHEIIDGTLSLFEPSFKPMGIRINVMKSARRSIVMADAEHLRRALMILLTNSRDALEGVAHPMIRIETTDGMGGITISVTDNGCGIKPEHLTQVFNPFFTTKPPGKGTGLGLSILHSIVHGAGGTAVAESYPGIPGATFTLHLPASLAMAA